MKSSGQTKVPTAISCFSEPTEQIASTRSQPALEQRAQVGGVVDPVGQARRARRRAVALQDLGVVRRRRAASRPLGPGAGRVAAENHRQASHRCDPTTGRVVSPMRWSADGGQAVGTRRDRGRAPRPQPQRAAAGAARRAARRPGPLRLPARGALPAELQRRSPPSRRRSTSATLLCTAISAALLISPSAYHRLTFRYQQKDRPRLHRQPADDRRPRLPGAGDDRGADADHRRPLRRPSRRSSSAPRAFRCSLVLWCLLPLRRRVSLREPGALPPDPPQER